MVILVLISSLQCIAMFILGLQSYTVFSSACCFRLDVFLTWVTISSPLTCRVLDWLQFKRKIVDIGGTLCSTHSGAVLGIFYLFILPYSLGCRGHVGSFRWVGLAN